MMLKSGRAHIIHKHLLWGGWQAWEALLLCGPGVPLHFGAIFVTVSQCLMGQIYFQRFFVRIVKKFRVVTAKSADERERGQGQGQGQCISALKINTYVCE